MINKYVKALGINSLLAAIFVVGTVIIPCSQAAALTTKTALFYGDSLMWEARPTILEKFSTKPSWKAYVHAWPAIALCDMTSWLPADLALYHPNVVTLETHGGGLSECMKYPPEVGYPLAGTLIPRDSDDYYNKVRNDLHYFFDTATKTGAKVVFYKTPPEYTASDLLKQNKLSPAQIEQNTISAIATEVASNYHGVSISSSGRTALGGNKWISYKTCLAIETLTKGCGVSTSSVVVPADKIIVRAPDKVHFCPQPYYDYNQWINIGCSIRNTDPISGAVSYTPYYSSGAYRYGNAAVSTTINPPAPILP